MPYKRLSMRKLFDILRLRHETRLSYRAIGRCLRVSHTTVRQYLERFEQAGLTWPLEAELDQGELERRLFPAVPTAKDRPIPDWATVHTELRSPGVTLQLLWYEYKSREPDGFQYTWYTTRYRQWAQKCDWVMRQVHRAGEKLFVDYAGHTIPVHDQVTGEVFQAQIFVASLGASSYTYAEATQTQNLADWIGAHVRAFRFYGGVAELVIPDNLRSGVDKSHRYEPDINRSYQEMATHYGVAVMPARVRAPRDKAVVESNVCVVERWILARLRHETFLSLAALNARIAELVTWVNERPFRKLSGSRRSFFEALDRPALRALPAEDYAFSTWRYARVPRDYHIELSHHHYSVPCHLTGQRIEVSYTNQTVECFFKGRRVASHVRSVEVGGTTTVRAHQPKAHQIHGDWDRDRMLAYGDKRGGAIQRVLGQIEAEGPHLQVALRRTLAVSRLEGRFGADRLEAACKRALVIGSASFKSIESILKTGLDQTPVRESVAHEPVTSEHRNLRGRTYFN
jgi:transposase